MNKVQCKRHVSELLSWLPFFFILFHTLKCLQHQAPLKLHRIELSQASKAELELIPGVGPHLSKKLMAFSGNQLTSIEGIGSKREATLLKFLKW